MTTAQAELLRGVRIPVPMRAIEDFCRKWQVCELALFGSVLRDDFRQDSDVDVLIDFAPGVRHGLFAVAQMEEELQEILGRNVDLFTRRGVEVTQNHAIRDTILRTARIIHGE